MLTDNQQVTNPPNCSGDSFVHFLPKNNHENRQNAIIFSSEIEDQTESVVFRRTSPPPPSPSGEGRGEVQKPLVSTTARKHV